MPSRLGEVDDPMLPRKASSDVLERPVPETDTGGQVEHTEATGELWLRNSANCPRNFGRRGAGRVNTLAVGAWYGRREQGEATVY